MNLRKLARLEKRVPTIAVRALAAAQRRACASGRTVLVVRDGGLYKLSPAGEYDLVERLLPRVKAPSRVKYASA